MVRTLESCTMWCSFRLAKGSAVPVTGQGTFKSLSTWTEIACDEKSVRSRCKNWECCFTFIIFIFLATKEKVPTFSSLEPCTVESLTGHTGMTGIRWETVMRVCSWKQNPVSFLLWLSLSASLSPVFGFFRLAFPLALALSDSVVCNSHKWHLN